MLKDVDRIFQNLYNDRWYQTLESSKKRGDWINTKDIIEKGRDWIINEVKSVLNLEEEVELVFLLV